MKRLVSLALAMVMIFTMSLSVSAANVTVNDALNNHKFTAYQIFKGTQATDGDGALGDVEWGNGINNDAFLNALKAAEKLKPNFENCTTAADVAVAIGQFVSNSDNAKLVAKIATKHIKGNGTVLNTGTTELADGYYLIVDTSESVGNGNAYNASLLQVTKDININVKTDKPSVEKKVFENKKYTTDATYGDGFNDVADYNMGDSVKFHLIGTVPDMTYYDTYKYVFHDTLDAGFTAPEQGTIKVYLSDDKIVNVGTDTDITSYFTTNVEGQNITVSCTDLKKVDTVTKGKYILVEYSAVLNQNAVVGNPGNKNAVYLEYSNKPDQSGSGDNSTGNTVKDEVIVFTYEMEVNKVDGKNQGTKLEAEFKLKNAEGKYAVVNEEGKVTDWVDAEKDATVLKSTGGVFTVTGLDDGTYTLVETKAPAGYNKPEKGFEVTITATTANGHNGTDQALTELKVKVNEGKDTTGDKDTGKVSITIENNKGAVLPETGGVGTTIFYVLGAVLVVGGVILLVVRKRMNK